MGLLPLCCHVFNVCLCVSSCNWLKLETTAQLTHAGKVFGTFEETVICIFFVRQFCFPTEQEKRPPFSDLTNTGTQHAANMSCGCVTHVKNTTGLSKASNHTIKSHTNPVKLGVLRVLWQSKLLHDPKPLGAQTRGKYSKEKQKDKTLGHMWLSSLADCVLFVVFVGVCWWPAASGSERDSCNIPVLFNEAESLHVIYAWK